MQLTIPAQQTQLAQTFRVPFRVPVTLDSQGIRHIVKVSGKCLVHVIPCPLIKALVSFLSVVQSVSYDGTDVGLNYQIFLLGHDAIL